MNKLHGNDMAFLAGTLGDNNAARISTTGCGPCAQKVRARSLAGPRQDWCR